MTPMGTKTCTKCGAEKPATEFARHPQIRDGRDVRCLVCKREASRGYYQRWTPEQRMKHRARVLRTRYGIELAMLDAMYQRQEGCCAICGTPGDKPASHEKRKAPKHVLCVDHDHETGEVRGLLCRSCNKGLGNFSDDVVRLIRATAYLTQGSDDLRL